MAGLAWLAPDWPDAPVNVCARMTTRAGGVSEGPYGDGDGTKGGGLNLGTHVGDPVDRVLLNRARLAAQLPGPIAWLNQVHGVGVADAELAARAALPVTADASVARVPGVVCAVLTADCLPVLFAARDGSVVAAAHAGWRGLAAGVLSTTVAAMRAAGAGEITAWMGPAIGPAVFEVGAEVLATFIGAARDAVEADAVAAAFVARAGHPGKYLADIYALARCMLAREGAIGIAGGTLCTVSEESQFYSYRRDHITGRQASLIWRL